MRIGLTGAQGVGKSTLARALAKELNLPIIEEQARVVAQDLGISNPRELKDKPELGKQFQWRCLTYQVSKEKRLINYGEGYIADRTVIDNAAYWLKWHQQGAESDKNMRYYKTVGENVQNYDLVVYVANEFAPDDDGFRSTNIHYQDEIAFLIQSMLAVHKVGYITVYGSIEQRVEQVMQRLAVVS